ncbi:MAG TPA: PP2C family protein-serine/threonine phosphatase [Mycobacteriales bacterium]
MALTDQVGTLLPALDAAFPTDLVDVLTSFLREHASADEVDLLLADYDLEILVRIRRDEPAASTQTLAVSSSEAGRAFTAQATVVQPMDGAVVVYVPVSLRAERLGVLRIRLPEPVPPDTVAGLLQVATVVGYVIFAAGRFTDMIEQARRRKPLALDAEMQWTLLPVRAFSGPQFDIAGQLMPAYEVGGDSFDYSVETDHLHLSVTDAMGHGLQASLLDSLAVAALRNARRSGHDVAAQAQLAHKALRTQFGGAQFVTGLIARAELTTGAVTIVNAGHPRPHLLRAGRLTEVELPVQLPLGLVSDVRYTQHQFALEPGDRLFAISDGVTDAGPARAQPFGEDRLQGLLYATAGEPPHEAVRHVLRTISDYQQEHFRDDATALCLDWRGPGHKSSG